jgi:hypothetical protein
MNPAARDRGEWTPVRGLVRAAAAGLIATIILSALMAPVATWAAPVLLHPIT